MLEESMQSERGTIYLTRTIPMWHALQIGDPPSTQKGPPLRMPRLTLFTVPRPVGTMTTPSWWGLDRPDPLAGGL
jgi:hypothetical protein